jgi:hypothetical protein
MAVGLSRWTNSRLRAAKALLASGNMSAIEVCGALIRSYQNCLAAQ